MSAETIPPEVVILLWDVDPDTLDLDRDRDLLFERVMTRGTWAAMKWLRRRYTTEQIATFVESERARRLPARDIAYWALIAGVELPTRAGDAAGVDLPTRVRGGRPPWAGP